jgi:hypothetical protein
MGHKWFSWSILRDARFRALLRMKQERVAQAVSLHLAHFTWQREVLPPCFMMALPPERMAKL